MESVTERLFETFWNLPVLPILSQSATEFARAQVLRSIVEPIINNAASYGTENSSNSNSNSNSMNKSWIVGDCYSVLVHALMVQARGRDNRTHMLQTIGTGTRLHLEAWRIFRASNDLLGLAVTAVELGKLFWHKAVVLLDVNRDSNSNSNSNNNNNNYNKSIRVNHHAALFAQSLVFTEHALAFSRRINDFARAQRVENLLSTGYDFVASRDDQFVSTCIASVPLGRKRDLVSVGVEHARSKRPRPFTREAAA